MLNLDKIKPSNLWYVIGYIATDGCLSSDGRHIDITSKDRQHLYLIRDSLLLKNKIGRKSRKKHSKKIYSFLQFGDVKFYNYLVSVGLTPRKSLNIGAIKVGNDFFADFLRGVIDGDGDISTWIHNTNGYNQWCLRISSASLKFLEWLNEEIFRMFSVKGKIYSSTKKDRINLIYRLKFGVIAASKIIPKTYYSNCLALERKQILAQLCLQHRSKNGKLCKSS